MEVSLITKENTEEKNDVYVVFKGNILISAGK